ncbi:uncharacterized protein B0H18DRAFT_1150769 [Fomitopsis serialis]|uniref:uncharacterized protein n=1 Tax=Fomitopsis serialis TaxID=139415 RepID=UPI0020076520|nr:uncharacterized protein B0H18DRAFT_1150769 [Neoantrodia serialis]KAH9937155.1 hypothetical protein B0H18DRAFT_1150769 [Neoantrodia serialis]
MADPTLRASLQYSYSFPTSLVDYSQSRPAKRRASASAHFLPSEETFNPRPYQPSHSLPSQPRQSQAQAQAQARARAQAQARPKRKLKPKSELKCKPKPNLRLLYVFPPKLLAQSWPTEFGSLSDRPGAVFIHPPFTNFPDADRTKTALPTT